MSYQDFVNDYIATLRSKDATYFKINSVMSIIFALKLSKQVANSFFYFISTNSLII